MSRTDVHRPWQVQVNDPYNRHRVYRFQSWAHEPPELFPAYQTCGCRMCTGHYERIIGNRRQRAAWHQIQRVLLKTGIEEIENVDTWIHPAEAW